MTAREAEVLRVAFADVVAECEASMDEGGDVVEGVNVVAVLANHSGDRGQFEMAEAAEEYAGVLAEAAGSTGDAAELLGRLLRVMPLEWWREVVK